MLAVLTRLVAIPSKGAWQAVTWPYFFHKAASKAKNPTDIGKSVRREGVAIHMALLPLGVLALVDTTR